MSEIAEAFGITPRVIKFFRREEAFGYMSNFSSHPVIIKDRSWPTTEHFYQAMKFIDFGIQERVRNSGGPGACAKMGRDRSLPMREDWDRIKDNVMRLAILAKFTQHPHLKSGLLSTGDAILIEDSPYDSYWGCGKDGTGKNMLGVTLMWARDILQLTEYDS